MHLEYAHGVCSSKSAKISPIQVTKRKANLFLELARSGGKGGGGGLGGHMDRD